NLGCVYYLRGEYEKATTHFTYAVHLLRTSGDLSESRLAGLSLNIGSAWYEMNRPEKAVQWWILAEKQKEHLSWSWQARLCLGMGNLSFQNEEFRKALTGYIDVLASLPSGAEVSGEEVWIRKNIALCYGKLHLPDSALVHLDTAINRIHASGGSLRYYLPDLFLIKGRLYRSKGDYNRAFEMFDRGLGFLQRQEDAQRGMFECEQIQTRFHQLCRTGMDTASVRDLLEVILPLTEKEECRELCGIALDLLFRVGIKNPEEIRQFIQIAERFRSLQVQAEVGYSGYQQLGKQLFWYHKQRLGSDSSAIVPAMDQTEQEIRIWNKRDSIYRNQSQEPDVYSEQFSGVPDAQKIMEALDQEEALLEFIVADSLLFSVFICRDSFSIVRSVINSHFLKAVSSFEKALRTADEGRFYETSRWLYDRLMAPFGMLISHQEKLRIIPGQLFFSLPFEALIKRDSGPDFNRLNPHFLLQDVEISYSVSITSWYTGRMDGAAGQARERSAYTYDFLACSPDFSKARDYAKLVYAATEVDLLVQLFRKRNLRTFNILTGQQMEEDFLACAGLSRIVHLASHAHKDPGNPEFSGWILSPEPTPAPLPGEADGWLEIGELQDFWMKTDLLVLSTCSVGETRARSWYRMTGFPDNFLQAGVKNILFSLWDISDEHTFHFMLDFYGGILNGDPYATALRKAKLHMLNCPETASPTLWAPFVLYSK
ncbi:MAG: CHAT domain-containing tetratricopeptide repeat protein, partial [bacterium]